MLHHAARSEWRTYSSSQTPGATSLASRSTNSSSKRPIAMVKCRMHQTTQAQGTRKIGGIPHLPACKAEEGMPRRKAI